VGLLDPWPYVRRLQRIRRNIISGSQTHPDGALLIRTPSDVPGGYPGSIWRTVALPHLGDGLVFGFVVGSYRPCKAGGTFTGGRIWRRMGSLQAGSQWVDTAIVKKRKIALFPGDLRYNKIVPVYRQRMFAMKTNQKILEPVSAEKGEFEAIKPIRSPVLQWLIKLVPVAIILGLPLILWPSNLLRIPGKEMFATGMLASALALFAFNILLDRMSTIFATLWRRGSISGIKNPDEKAQSRGNEEVVVSYRQFMQEVEDQLNSRYQWIMAGVFIILMMLWYLPILISMGRGFIIILGLVVETIIAFVIGAVVWRMVLIT
jgi:hypothetical protein